MTTSHSRVDVCQAAAGWPLPARRVPWRRPSRVRRARRPVPASRPGRRPHRRPAAPACAANTTDLPFERRQGTGSCPDRCLHFDVLDGYIADRPCQTVAGQTPARKAALVAGSSKLTLGVPDQDQVHRQLGNPERPRSLLCRRGPLSILGPLGPVRDQVSPEHRRKVRKLREGRPFSASVVAAFAAGA
jgi:hypothetical protein